MDIRKLQRAIVDGLEDVKAQNIVVFNTEHLSPLFERVIVASGTSNRQTKALASSVRDSVKSRGMEVLRTEGEDNGEWIIVDCGAAVAHIMQPAIREYYQLEEIWGGKAVKMKIGPAKTGLVKASEPDDVPAPARKGSARKTASKPPAAQGGSTAGAAKPARAVPGSDKPARKKTSAAPAATDQAPARKRPARKAAPRKPVQTIVVGQPARKAASKTARKTAAPAAKKAARKVARKPAR
jgi:ribosome-associated protein